MINRTRGKRAAREHRRRAGIACVSGQWTPAEWREITARYEGQCACCGKVGKFDCDHVVAIANIRDGRIPEPLWGGNAAESLQPLCHSCNSSHQRQIVPYTCICGRKFEASHITIIWSQLCADNEEWLLCPPSPWVTPGEDYDPTYNYQ